MARIPEIELSAEELARLVRRLDDMADEAVTLSGNWEQLHDGYLRQYRCIPEYEQRSWPGGGPRSNLFLPLTRAVIDAYMAQQFDAMFSQEPIIKVRPMGANGQNVQDAELLSIYYGEYVFKKLIPLRNLGNDFLFDLDLDGTASMKVRWQNELEMKRSLTLERQPDKRVDSQEIDGIMTRSEVIVGEKENWVENVIVEPVNKPAIDVVDMARLYFAPDTVESFQWPHCRWYYEEHEVPWEQMLERRRAGYNGIDDELKANLSVKQGTDRDDTGRQVEELAEGENPKTVTVREYYMRWPLPARVSYTDADGKQVSRDQSGILDEESFWEEVIVTYLPQVRQVSRIRPLGRVYPNYRRPNIVGRFIRLPRLLYGLGLAEKMSQLNRMTNSLFNQAIDYGTLQNMPWYFFTPSVTGNLPDVVGIRPGGGVPVNDPRGVVIPRLQGDVNFWLTMMNMVQAFVERDGGITDFNLGRQSAAQGAPKTARATLALMGQSNIAFGRQVAMHTSPMVEALDAVHALNKRYAPEDIVFDVLNEDMKSYKEARISRRSMEQELNFEIELNPNRSAEQQKYTSAFQFTLQALTTAMQAPVLMEPVRKLLKQVYSGMGLKNFDDIWPAPRVPNIDTSMMGGMMPPVTSPARPVKENVINVKFPAGPVESSSNGTNGDGTEPYQ